MKKTLVFVFLIVFSLYSHGQCIKVSESKNEKINGNYSLLETKNFYGHPVYAHTNGNYFIHRDDDNWYINQDKDSPDENPLAFCNQTSDTIPLTGWKTIDGTPSPKFVPDCN